MDGTDRQRRETDLQQSHWCICGVRYCSDVYWGFFHYRQPMLTSPLVSASLLLSVFHWWAHHLTHSPERLGEVWRGEVRSWIVKHMCLLLLTTITSVFLAGLPEPGEPPETVCSVQQLLSPVQQLPQPLRQSLVNPTQPWWSSIQYSFIYPLRSNRNLVNPLWKTSWLNSERSAIHKDLFVLNRIVTMEFYGKNDLTLGIFLERYCFRWGRNIRTWQIIYWISDQIFDHEVCHWHVIKCHSMKPLFFALTCLSVCVRACVCECMIKAILSVP